MNNDMLGIVYAGNRELSFNELTQMRSVSALPFAGRYRVIDFILSNMVNSGIINVGVAPKINYFSLMDHLGSGAPWDLNRTKSGLFILPPYIRGDIGKPSGTIDLIYGVLTFLRRSRQKYVLLSEGNTICNITFYDALKFHIEKNADITIIYNDNKTTENLENCNLYTVDENKRITEAFSNPRCPKSTLSGMEMFIVERLKLIGMIEEAYSRGSHDFICDIIFSNLNRLNIYGYEHKGFVARINSVESYFNANMKMLDNSVRKEIFGGENPIFTKVKNQVPTKYGKSANATSSLIADGCNINGVVENSIISRGVYIGEGSHIKNSIIMQNSVIEENCDLEYVIIDKECTLRRNKRLVGQPGLSVILPKRTLI